MTGHTTKSHSSPLDIITYRYKDELVYVPISTNYFQALIHAKDAFPQLKRHRDASLSLSLLPAHRNPSGEQKPIGISAAAWPKLISHMAQYQVVDVHVASDVQTPSQTQLQIPDITITYADAEDPVPPPYAASGKHADASTDDEKTTYRCEESAPRSRTQSTTSLQHKRSWLFQKLHG